MSLLNLYMNSNGSNLNAGTTCSDVGGGSNSADYTSTAGNFDGTSVFTPTDGSTPASFIAVGDWVSLYNTGDTAVRCLAKVTTVAAGVNGAVTIDPAHKFGTVPVSNSGSRALKHGGAFADLGVVATNAALNAGTATDSVKINVKAGTYANTNTSRVFNLSGSATAVVWWDGYKTTPGDLDAKPVATRTPGTDMPSWTWTTGSVFNPNSSHVVYSGIDFTSASITTGTLNAGGSLVALFERCRFTNTGGNALSGAANMGAATARFVGCYFNAPGTATATVKGANGTLHFVGGNVTGGGVGIQFTTGTTTIIGTLFPGVGSHAIQHTGAPSSVIIYGNSGYSAAAGDFYNFTAAPTFALVANNEVYGFSNAINNTSGTNTDAVIRANNSWLAASEVGMGDTPNFDGFAESGLPFNSTSDLTLLTTAVGYKNGLPGLFENSTTQAYGSVGAATPNVTAGGAAGSRIQLGM